MAALVVIRDSLLLVAALAGLGLPWLPWLRSWPPLERLALAAGAALLTGGLAGFGLYAAGLPLGWFWLAPGAGLALALVSRDDTRALLADAEVRGTVGRWALLAAAGLGWQMVVSVYSGAAWQADWYEHFDRAHFFLDRWPREFLFVDVYPLPSRPPLVNIWSAVLMSAAGGAFFHHQVFLTLLGSLIFLPLAVQVRRAQPDAAGQWLLLLLLLASPFVIQNLTFPWTKLPAAFFVLLAWQQLAPGPTAAAVGDRRLVVAALALAGGMLAHYSTGPWTIAFLVAWLTTQRTELRRPGTRRAVLLGAGLAAVVFLTWMGWAVAHYGAWTTFAGNTTVALAPSGSIGERVAVFGTNLLHTLSPVSLVGLDHPLLAQASAWGRLRDGWFILYQLKLWWTVGSAGAIIAGWLLWREPAGPGRRFGLITAGLAIALGLLAHTQPDLLGLTHVVLQPLVLFMLGWLAGHAGALSRPLAQLYAAGLVLDFCAGILVHFALQAGWLNRAVADPWAGYTSALQASFQSKTNLQLVFLADRGLAPAGVALIGLVLLAGLAGWRRGRAANSPDSG